MSFFIFPRWAEMLLGGKPAPTMRDVTFPEAEAIATRLAQTPPPTKRGRGRPPGAKNKAK